MYTYIYIYTVIVIINILFHANTYYTEIVREQVRSGVCDNVQVRFGRLCKWILANA